MSLTLCKEAKAYNFCPFIIIFHCHVYFLLKRSSFHAWAQVFECPKLSLSLSLSLLCDFAREGRWSAHGA